MGSDTGTKESPGEASHLQAWERPLWKQARQRPGGLPPSEPRERKLTWSKPRAVVLDQHCALLGGDPSSDGGR